MLQYILPHNVPLVNNTKETPLRPALQLQRHKPVTPVKVDRLNFLTGYHPPLHQFLVNGFSYGFRVGFLGEQRAAQSPNLRNAFEQPQAVWSKQPEAASVRQNQGSLSPSSFSGIRLFPFRHCSQKRPFRISFNSTLIVPVRLFSERLHTGENFLDSLRFLFSCHYGNKKIGGWLLYG